MHPKFYSSQLKASISFFISHFHEIKEEFLNQIKEGHYDIDYGIIEEVLRDPKLELESEDELVEFVNDLYDIDAKYSILYEYVEFINVSASCMKEFIEKFDFNDLSSRMWSSIGIRLCQEVKQSEAAKNRHKYFSSRFLIKFEPKNDEFDGIFNYLQRHGNIKDELDITYSSKNGGDPFNLLQYENKDSYFQTNDSPNSWICFEFKKHQVIPSDYIIRSYKGEDNYHPKTWKIEGSTDKQNWIQLDSRTNNDNLRGASRVHLFHISINEHKDDAFKYLRLQQTGPTWYGNKSRDHHLLMDSIEFYGKII